MPRIVLSEKDKKYIKANYLDKPSRQLAKKIGCSKSLVLSFLKRENLVVPKEVVKKWRTGPSIGRTILTPKQDAILKKYYLEIPVKTLAKQIGVSGTCLSNRIKQLGLVIPEDVIEQRKNDSLFKKGIVPWNKGKSMSDETRQKVKHTWFKKGHIPHNYVDGEFLSKDGYIVLSMGNGKQRLKHIHEWEQINGPLPKSYCLRCKNGDILNTDPSNWELITREENMLRNSIHRYPDELKKSIKKLSAINKLIKTKYNEQIEFK